MVDKKIIIGLVAVIAVVAVGITAFVLMDSGSSADAEFDYRFIDVDESWTDSDDVKHTPSEGMQLIRTDIVVKNLHEDYDDDDTLHDGTTFSDSWFKVIGTDDNTYELKYRYGHGCSISVKPGEEDSFSEIIFELPKGVGIKSMIASGLDLDLKFNDSLTESDPYGNASKALQA